MALNWTKTSVDIGIVVQDAEAMVAFYRDVLGLPEVGTFTVPGGTHQRFSLGDTTIKLVIADDQPSSNPLKGNIKDATGIRYWTAFCTAVDDTVAECLANGATELVPLNTVPSGLRYAVLSDPDGNCFELIENLAEG